MKIKPAAQVVRFGKIVVLLVPELVKTKTPCARSNAFKSVSALTRSHSSTKEYVKQKLSASNIIRSCAAKP